MPMSGRSYQLQAYAETKSRMVMTRAEFCKILVAGSLMIRGNGAAEESDRDATQAVEHGLKKLNDVFWLPEIANWVDRPQKDLRAVFEGRMNPPWWSCANVVEGMIDWMNRTSTTSYDAQIREIYEGNVIRGGGYEMLANSMQKNGDWKGQDQQVLARKKKELETPRVNASQFRNEYLDDSGWWALAWLAFYERTKESNYLATTISIHEHMASGWRQDGGISWALEPDKRGANAITNSLFVVLSARLYCLTKNQDYLNWAKKALNWQKQVKLYDGFGIVDRPGHRGDYWTYNQGVYLGGFEALHAATGEIKYLKEAALVVKSMIEKSGIVTSEKILLEKLSTEGWDVGMFKGICARYWGLLARSLRRAKIRTDVAAQIEDVLCASRKAVLALPQKQGLYPLEWQSQPRAEVVNFNTHASAILLLMA